MKKKHHQNSNTKKNEKNKRSSILSNTPPPPTTHGQHPCVPLYTHVDLRSSKSAASTNKSNVLCTASIRIRSPFSTNANGLASGQSKTSRIAGSSRSPRTVFNSKNSENSENSDEWIGASVLVVVVMSVKHQT